MGTLTVLSSCAGTPGFSALAGGRCAVTDTVVADIFLRAGSVFKRPLMAVINDTAPRPGLIISVSKTVPGVFDPLESLPIWLSGETLES